LFSPIVAEAERQQVRRRERNTPLYPSHQARYDRQRKAHPEVAPGQTYTASSLRKAIHRAVREANRERAKKGEQPIALWNPYQIRHSVASRLRKEYGLEMVRCLLGHSSAEMSEWYAEVDLEKARRVMEEAG
jgi:integrase